MHLFRNKYIQLRMKQYHFLRWFILPLPSHQLPCSGVRWPRPLFLCVEKPAPYSAQASLGWQAGTALTVMLMSMLRSLNSPVLPWGSAELWVTVLSTRGRLSPQAVTMLITSPAFCCQSENGMWPSLGCHTVSLIAQWALGLELSWAFESDIAISYKPRPLNHFQPKVKIYISMISKF